MEELDIDAEWVAPHSPDAIVVAPSSPLSAVGASGGAACHQQQQPPHVGGGAGEKHPCGLFSCEDYETAIRVLNALAPHTEGERKQASSTSARALSHLCATQARVRVHVRVLINMNAVASRHGEVGCAWPRLAMMLVRVCG
jgi:hypothetical protein